MLYSPIYFLNFKLSKGKMGKSQKRRPQYVASHTRFSVFTFSIFSRNRISSVSKASDWLTGFHISQPLEKPTLCALGTLVSLPSVNIQSDESSLGIDPSALGSVNPEYNLVGAACGRARRISYLLLSKEVFDILYVPDSAECRRLWKVVWEPVTS